MISAKLLLAALQKRVLLLENDMRARCEAQPEAASPGLQTPPTSASTSRRAILCFTARASRRPTAMKACNRHLIEEFIPKWDLNPII